MRFLAFFFLAFFLAVLLLAPVYAKVDAGDVHRAIEAQFGANKIAGVAVDGKAVTRYDWAGASAQDKTDIQNWVSNTYDWNQKGAAEKQQEKMAHQPGAEAFEKEIRAGIASGAIDANALVITGQLAKEQDASVRGELWKKVKANPDMAKWLDAGNISAIEDAANNNGMPLK